MQGILKIPQNCNSNIMMINPGPWDSGLLNVQANLKLAASSAPETGPASKPLTMSLRRQEVSLTSTAETPRKIG